jgi:hypothetical protein
MNAVSFQVWDQMTRQVAESLRASANWQLTTKNLELLSMSLNARRVAGWELLASCDFFERQQVAMPQFARH